MTSLKIPTDAAPGTEIAFCPVCGEEVFRHHPGTVLGDHWSSVMAEELVATTHLRSQHRLRFWLWRRTGWVKWLKL